MTLRTKRILLGITGGIAAYKAPELVRQLRGAGAEVQVVMSHGAEQFVTPIALQAVSEREVRTSLWDRAAEAAMGHIELARWADAVVIAPATAHCMAKLAAGEADDLLTTLCLATGAPLALAPAMNQGMWHHAAVQRNLATLEADGVTILGPGDGDQACGDVGPGRMLEPEQLLEGIEALFVRQTLRGCRVLVTAGPTQEAIDPVRYISNRSSGKQGFALARCARAAGAEVTLVTGPVSLVTPLGVTRIDVATAQEMHDAVQRRLAGTDIFIGVAAVCDYRPAERNEVKIKKRGDNEPLSLLLTENPDIIAAVAAGPGRPFTVGFAAETHDGLDHARAKLRRKGLDLIVLNDVSDPAIGFGSEENALTLLGPELEEALPRAPKRDLGHTLIARIAELRAATQRSEDGATGRS